MTADSLRLRRARRAIYGPPTAALVGVVLLGIGVVGLVNSRDTTTDTDNKSTIVPPAILEAPRGFLLVDAKGRLYPGGVAAPVAGVAERAAVPRGATIVAAASDPRSVGGHWLVTSDGRVVALGTSSLGEHRVLKGTSPFVGIAAPSTGGYWLARADGHVYAIGARRLGDLSRTRHAPVVGITATREGGYWLAMSDGTVRGFGTASRTSSARKPSARIVGITASATGGFWLAGSDGRVYSFGKARRGDPVRLPKRTRVVAIAPSPDGGYWLTTTNGRVYASGNLPPPPRSSSRADRIVAIIPR